uniref:Ventricular zone expressed PH domain containing 1 n=1 Tax=Gopherus agassizii TaxID=38772 RepID=A0A452I3D0_9SAUR
MHHLFGLVLGQKDLSRAGDLFSLDDAEIEGSLSEALEQIKIISSSPVSKTCSAILLFLPLLFSPTPPLI